MLGTFHHFDFFPLLCYGHPFLYHLTVSLFLCLLNELTYKKKTTGKVFSRLYFYFILFFLVLAQELGNRYDTFISPIFITHVVEEKFISTYF